MIRSFVLVALVFAAFVAVARPDEPALAAPDGWGGETIQLPPGFAKDLTLKGVEHIRFAPGMMSAKSDTFFCYAFAFELEPDLKLTEELLRSEILKYYRGLCKAVAGSKVPDLDTSKFTFQLQSLLAADAKSFPADTVHFGGILDWIEPFSTQKPQKLYLKLQTWKTKKHRYLFVCVSPRKTDAEIWTKLHKIRDDYIQKNR